jgi:hypothetical protein
MPIFPSLDYPTLASDPSAENMIIVNWKCPECGLTAMQEAGVIDIEKAEVLHPTGGSMTWTALMKKAESME